MPHGPHMSFLALILAASAAVAQAPAADATPRAGRRLGDEGRRPPPPAGAAKAAPRPWPLPVGARRRDACSGRISRRVHRLPLQRSSRRRRAGTAAPEAATVEAPAAEEAPVASDVPAVEAAEEDAFAGSDDLGDEGMDEEFGGPPKLAPGFTGIWGRLVDGKNGDALIEGSVKVVSGGSSKRALSDVDGYYTLALPPGTYDLRVFYELYQGRRISNVKVEAGKAVQLDVGLDGDAGAIQELVVETTVDRRREAAVLQERKSAAVVSDALSSQEMSRTPDSSASDAAKRVVSLTVEDGKYVFIRGLGGRYSMTLLNGVALPSPEPDRQEVPLDIFPTSLLSSLTVFKTYDPAIPGTFGGGALQIGTAAYPSNFEASVKIGLSGDTQTTFQDAYGYRGGKFDFLGWDDGSRAMPSAVPDQEVDLDSRKGMPRDRVAEIGRSFSNNWDLTHPPRAAQPLPGRDGCGHPALREPQARLPRQRDLQEGRGDQADPDRQGQGHRRRRSQQSPRGGRRAPEHRRGEHRERGRSAQPGLPAGRRPRVRPDLALHPLRRGQRPAHHRPRP